jgi:hypothetical protein
MARIVLITHVYDNFRDRDFLLRLAVGAPTAGVPRPVAGVIPAEPAPPKNMSVPYVAVRRSVATRRPLLLGLR